jgi:hypothetical protein
LGADALRLRREVGMERGKGDRLIEGLSDGHMGGYLVSFQKFGGWDLAISLEWTAQADWQAVVWDTKCFPIS